MNALEIVQQGPVLPVIVLSDAGLAVDLAHALVEGGVKVLEVTLRTPTALDAIRRMSEVPGAIVGAGTVLNRAQWEQAVQAGAQFGVSPGFTDEIGAAARAQGLPFLPGVATPGESLAALDAGFSVQKLFPAEAVGGIALLKALHSPLPQVRFCPTGGIGPKNAPDYLALPNVVCVGGSWLVPAQALAQRDWAAITALAREASALGG